LAAIICTVEEAIGEIKNGDSVAFHAWGNLGLPRTLLNALRDSGVKDLTVYCNNFLLGGAAVTGLPNNAPGAGTPGAEGAPEGPTLMERMAMLRATGMPEDASRQARIAVLRASNMPEGTRMEERMALLKAVGVAEDAKMVERMAILTAANLPEETGMEERLTVLKDAGVADDGMMADRIAAVKAAARRGAPRLVERLAMLRAAGMPESANIGQRVAMMRAAGMPGATTMENRLAVLGDAGLPEDAKMREIIAILRAASLPELAGMEERLAVLSAAGIPEDAKMAERIDAVKTAGTPPETVTPAGPMGQEGMMGFGLASLLPQMKKLVAPFIGGRTFGFLGDDAFDGRLADGTLEIETSSHGVFSERLMAGAMGMGGYYSPIGIGTIMEKGKEKRVIDGVTYLFEKPIRPDVGFVRAKTADKLGHLVYHGTARGSNPNIAMASKLTIAEVDEIVECGELDPEAIVTPGIFVDRIVKVPEDDAMTEEERDEMMKNMLRRRILVEAGLDPLVMPTKPEGGE